MGHGFLHKINNLPIMCEKKAFYFPSQQQQKNTTFFYKKNRTFADLHLQVTEVVKSQSSRSLIG